MFDHRPLTYGDFSRTGYQDCQNVFSYDEFDIKPGETAEQVVDRVMSKWEADNMEGLWIEQQSGDFEGLDPHKCYEAWRDSWRACAIVHIEEEIEHLADEAAIEAEHEAIYQQRMAKFVAQDWSDIADALMDAASQYHSGSEADYCVATARRIRSGDYPAPSSWWRIENALMDAASYHHSGPRADRIVDLVGQLRDNPAPRNWWRRPSPAMRLVYRTKADALKAFLDTNSDIVENYGGADYEVSPSEFDSINHKYDLKGKRAARSIAQAVWAAMPTGRPYSLDRIDLEALNDTSPAREAGASFRLPDINYEAEAAAAEAAHYAEHEEELPAWVTEHELHAPAQHVPPALPSAQVDDIIIAVELEEVEPGVTRYRMYPIRRLPPVEPMNVTLEDQEPGVSTFRFNPKKTYNEYAPAIEKGRRAKYGYNVIALDPATGVGQDGDTVRNLRDAIAWARAIAAGTHQGAYRGGRPVPMSAIVTAGYDEGRNPTVYSVSPPGYPVWREEQQPYPEGERPVKLTLEHSEPGVETYQINPSSNADPAWVTKTITKHYVELEDEIPAEWLPKITKAKAVKGGKLVGEMKEYGCGAYGCVLPTLDPDVVLKLTTDDTEAEFATKLADKLVKNIVVKYHLTRALPDTYRGREAYLLWRDSAEQVGEVLMAVQERGGDPIEAMEAIAGQHKAATAAFHALHEGKPGAKELLKEWVVAAKNMGKVVPELRSIANGMVENYEKKKIFFGDVHDGNIGLVKGRWLIIDPGHVAVLRSR